MFNLNDKVQNIWNDKIGYVIGTTEGEVTVNYSDKIIEQIPADLKLIKEWKTVIPMKIVNLGTLYKGEKI